MAISPGSRFMFQHRGVAHQPSFGPRARKRGQPAEAPARSRAPPCAASAVREARRAGGNHEAACGTSPNRKAWGGRAAHHAPGSPARAPARTPSALGCSAQWGGAHRPRGAAGRPAARSAAPQRGHVPRHRLCRLRRAPASCRRMASQATRRRALPPKARASARCLRRCVAPAVESALVQRLAELAVSNFPARAAAGTPSHASQRALPYFRPRPARFGSGRLGLRAALCCRHSAACRQRAALPPAACRIRR